MASEQVLEMLQAGKDWDDIQIRVHLDDAQHIIETLLPIMDEGYDHMIVTFINDHVPHDVLLNFFKNCRPEDHYYDAAMMMMYYMAEDITDHALQIKLLLYLRKSGDREEYAEEFYEYNVLPSYIHIMDSMNHMLDLIKHVIYRLIYDASWNPPHITEEMRDLAL